MRVVEVRNVTEAWARLPGVLIDAEEQDSRVGRVLVCPEPVTTVYLRPTERVLRDPRRDANPFFHLIEALWMLAGRDDAATLNHYIRDFGARFAEDGLHVHGAYGQRWRRNFGYDQLDVVVAKLRRSTQDRQAVIQMWDAHEDRADDLRGEYLDRPCNTQVFLRVQNRPEVRFAVDGPDQSSPHAACYSRRLDMTVCCRSNDMIFGGYGANAVHFSVLQEYLAARIGVGVGTYTQVSNNFHVYRDAWLAKRPEGEAVHTHEEWGPDWQDCLPMFTEPETIDGDLTAFFRWHDALWAHSRPPMAPYRNPWFSSTGYCVAQSYYHYRRKQLDAALSMARAIDCPAWRAACMDWLQRRGAW